MLGENEGIAFEGAKLSGEGFVVPCQWAISLLNREPLYRPVLRPYLTGAVLNGSADLSPQEYIVTFYGWPLSRQAGDESYHGPVATDFPECLAVVEKHVKPKRVQLAPSTAWNKKLREFWWHFGQWRWALDKAMESVSTVLVLSRVTPHIIVDRVEKNWVFSDRLTVFANDSDNFWGVLQSAVHEVWSRRYGTTNLSLLSYSPSSCFLTLPLPELEPKESGTDIVGAICELASGRRELARTKGVGLTEIYNRIHDSRDDSEASRTLRLLHKRLDQAVIAAYEWNDLDLGHGFHQTKQGVRYTISEEARRNVLDRLLTLNHQRHAKEKAEEMLLGKQPNTSTKRGRKKVSNALGEPTLQFEME
jgi:hypothetical protein